MDSMVYISALSELEAVMGTMKAGADIVDAAPPFCPAFICIGEPPHSHDDGNRTLRNCQND